MSKLKQRSWKWWLLVGWWWLPFKWSIIGIPYLIIKIYKWRKNKNNCTIISYQNNTHFKSDFQNKAIYTPAVINNTNWEISVSFGKSSSSNFSRAIYLAKNANKYEEYDFDGQTVYQAYFNAQPKSYLKFIELYELISGWKSVKVMINGKFVDRKIVGGLNYCYGDKCRTGRSDFCYGASDMTKNPFGCHRLQMSACNTPWISFARFDGRNYIIDKSAIYQRANEYSQAYRLCPCFNWDKIVEAINNLPDILTKKQFEKICLEENLTILKLTT